MTGSLPGIDILSTKLHIPATRAGRVLRERLLARLDRGTTGLLTLLAAAAGFGKTTLLSDWVHHADRRVGWLSLDGRTRPDGIAPDGIAPDGIAPDYARKLKLALRARPPAASGRLRGGGAELPEPLSDREVEVLRWVATGLTNRQAARKLFVETSTVKKHLEHVYGKLGVRNRTQAIARARELDIL